MFKFVASIFLLFCFNIPLFADTVRCNFNHDCRRGFVCVGGQELNYNPAFPDVRPSGPDAFKGTCQPMIAFRQLCAVWKFLSKSIFAYGIITIAVVYVGLQAAGVLVGGRLEMKTLVTLFVSIVFIVGSYQVVALLIGERVVLCELDYSSTVGGEAVVPSGGVVKSSELPYNVNNSNSNNSAP
ncbi:MAG: hypothetical protein RL208_665 [Pseudomonadota bacterium]|jgi:hypothetical protein